MSRLDSGALRPEPSNFRIAELLRQIEVEFAPIASAKGLELEFVPSSATVRSDRRLLRRVLQNLVSNAIKYTPKGRVLVGCRRRDGLLRIDVLDTGVGVPKAKQRDIFAEFHRLDHGARIARGLGLGLSIVERIARVLEHTVEVVSETGEGSRFSIEVPRVNAAPVSSPVTEDVLAQPGQLAGTTALCIDNEPAILDGMEMLLRGWGCDVIKAAGLDAALSIVGEIGPAPNGLLVDYHLDQGNGIAAIDRLRQRLGGDLPAILITADRSPRVRAEARAQNIQVLHKPIKPAALRAMLAQWRVLRVVAAE
jgi:CheY-like chemotaxis protein/anti-sigma regulatory factor (Ser/Thr protein kinase)